MNAPIARGLRNLAYAACGVTCLGMCLLLIIDARTPASSIRRPANASTAQEAFDQFADAVTQGDLEAGLAFCTLDGVESVHELGFWLSSGNFQPKFNEWNSLKATQEVLIRTRSELARNRIAWNHLSVEYAELSTGEHGFSVALVRRDGQWRIHAVSYHGVM